MAGKKEKKVDDGAMTIIVDGKHYVLDPDRITGKVERLVRQATGYRVSTAIMELSNSPGADLIAALCYAAALQSDINADFDKIEDSVTLTNIEIVDDDETEDDSPED